MGVAVVPLTATEVKGTTFCRLADANTEAAVTTGGVVTVIPVNAVTIAALMVAASAVAVAATVVTNVVDTVLPSVDRLLRSVVAAVPVLAVATVLVSRGDNRVAAPATDILLCAAVAGFAAPVAVARLVAVATVLTIVETAVALKAATLAGAKEFALAEAVDSAVSVGFAAAALLNVVCVLVTVELIAELAMPANVVLKLTGVTTAANSAATLFIAFW